MKKNISFPFHLILLARIPDPRELCLPAPTLVTSDGLPAPTSVTFDSLPAPPGSGVFLLLLTAATFGATFC
jgi:hypothetical protein